MSGQETHWQPRTAGYWLIWAGILKAKEQLRVQTRQALAGSQVVGEQEVGGGGRRGGERKDMGGRLLPGGKKKPPLRAGQGLLPLEAARNR